MSINLLAMAQTQINSNPKEEIMSRVRLTQETLLKHFMKRNYIVPSNDNYWINEAKKNHQERGGTGTVLVHKNTLLLIKPNVWQIITDGSYFGDTHKPPASALGQLALTIDKEDIDRIITTQKNAREYDVIYDVDNKDVVDVTFLCSYNAANHLYTIVHFEGLGN